MTNEILALAIGVPFGLVILLLIYLKASREMNTNNE